MVAILVNFAFLPLKNAQLRISPLDEHALEPISEIVHNKGFNLVPGSCVSMK